MIWLQSQVSTSVLGEFAQKWRTTAVPGDTNLRLIDVSKFYRGLAEQDQALDWLQKKSPAVIAEFAQKWHSQSNATNSPIRLIDARKFYRAVPNQNQALDWLEGKFCRQFSRSFFVGGRMPAVMVNNIIGGKITPVRLVVRTSVLKAFKRTEVLTTNQSYLCEVQIGN